MWKISEVKEKGRTAFKANYWICVLVAVIVALLGGGIGSGSGYKFGGNFSQLFNRGNDKEDRYEKDYDRDADDYFDDDYNEYDYDYDEHEEDDSIVGNFFGSNTNVAAGIALFLIFAVFFLIALVIGFALNVFLINPLKLGCQKFFLKNLEEPSNLSPVGAGFTTDYKNIIKILFFRDLYLFLWFLIPIAGCVMVIIKGYEYKMIPYLLAENPELTKDEAFEMSKEMMHGQKWSAFGLDLSFLGWMILSLFTFGILGIFYVNPYIFSTEAALYDTLKEETGVVNA